MSDPHLQEELRLDAVVAMADSKNLPGRLEGKVNEAFQQIAFADKIILNKLDLVTPDEAIALKIRIREINKFAKVLPAVRGHIRLSEILNVRAHDMCHFVNADIEVEAMAEDADFGHGGGHDEDCQEEHGGGHGGGPGAGRGGGHVSGHGVGHGHKSESSRHDSR